MRVATSKVTNYTVSKTFHLHLVITSTHQQTEELILIISGEMLARK